MNAKSLVCCLGLVLGFCLLGSAVCTAPTSLLFSQEISSEENVAQKIRNLGGKARKEDGKVISVWLGFKKDGARFSDDDVESIDFTVFSDLRSLSFCLPNISDRSLIHVRKTSNRLDRLLILSADRISDKECALLLKNQRTLTYLNLGGTTVGDGITPELGKLDQLTDLVLARTKVTDKGLGNLTSLRQLAHLYLSETAISDAGLKEVKKLTELRSLCLEGTKITDAGLQELSTLKDLRTLRLRSTRTTNAGEKQLRQALPKLEIVNSEL